MEIQLQIRKSEVMQEVAVTTAYTGGKMDNDGNALNRISTVDEDTEHLERFWDESRADLCQELLDLVSYEQMADLVTNPEDPDGPKIADTDVYGLHLNVSSAFAIALLPSMTVSLRSFFVHNIVAKWYIYTNKGEAGEYADKAATLLDDIHRKAVYKRKPTRPTYD